MGTLNDKLKEVLASVLPITIFVLLLHFTLTPLAPADLGRFLVGALMILVGLAVFLLGVDLAATPIGELSGGVLVGSGKLGWFLAGGLGLGFIISIAEPDLQILAEQVSDLTSHVIGKWEMVLIVSVGVGLLVMAGFWRIIRRVRLRTVLWVTYGIIFILALFNTPILHAFAFDASGSTTGAITTPFILALAAGVARITEGEGSDARDRFGLVGLASAGAILAVLAQNAIHAPQEMQSFDPVTTVTATSFFGPFGEQVAHVLRDSLLCIAPLTLVFFALQLTVLKLKKERVIRICVGLVYCYLGLSLFMIGVSGGFMNVGRMIGLQLLTEHSPVIAVLAGGILGMLTVIAEPAVHVLTHSIEENTGGTIPRKLVLIFLAVGVAFSVALSVVRVLVEPLQLWHILLPGYILIMIMSFFTPDLFLGIAFDAGGVASGPMTATFILAFTQGAATGAPTADVLVDGFGVVALVAMTPLIALQLLGLIYRAQTPSSADDRPDGGELAEVDATQEGESL